MAKGNRGGKRGESNAKPKGGGGGGNGYRSDMITVQPFDIAPENLKAGIGEKKNTGYSLENAIEKANPYYNSGDPNFTENCQRSVVAYELRRRGYDVVALPTYNGDKLPSGNKWSGAFQHAKIEHVGKSTPKATQAALEAKMHEYGKGSRGIVKIPGHVFNVENVNGKIRYVDAQTNTIYNSKNVFSRIGKQSVQIQLMRTDNLRISERAKKSVTPVTDTMRRIAKNKKVSKK